MPTPKCTMCGHTMTTKRENVPYRSLPGTVLVGVEVSRCAKCGEYEVAIPAINELNRMLAGAVIRKSGRLGGGEIRFLRSYLGYSATDFAEIIGSDKSTVSHWETGKTSIGHHADLLLRSLVMLGKKVESYPIATFKTIGDDDSNSSYMFAPTSNKQWEPRPAAS